MKTTMQLSINEPCSEKWESFDFTNRGGFCSACQKEVIDFTRVSDDEILRFFETNSNVCGRFRAKQLITYSLLDQAQVRPGYRLLKAGVVGLVLLLAGKPLSAQNIVERPKTEKIQTKNSDSTEHTQMGGIRLKGKVVSDDDGSPMPGVNIVLKGAEVGTVTDADGLFEFPQDLKVGDVLLFSFVGLRTEEFQVSGKPSDSFEMKMSITMKMDFEIMGKVAVNKIYEVEPTGIRKFWSKVKNVFSI